MSKRIVFWFINIKDKQQYQVSALLRQLSDSFEKCDFLRKNFDMIIVPSDENKMCLMQSREEFVSEFPDNETALKWLDKVKNNLTDCLTISLEKQED